MRVLITDVTRMERGFICIAGIDVDTGKRVRPVLANRERIPLAWVRSQGGLVDFRRVLDIGDTRCSGPFPEVEDATTSADAIRLVSEQNGGQFFRALEAASAPNPLAEFGTSLRLHQNGRSYVTPSGVGSRSLVLTALEPDTIEIYQRRPGGAIRARWADGMDLAVTDLRLFQADGVTPHSTRVHALKRALQREAGFLGLGLTRPWSNPDSGDSAWYHWLQVNAIHVPTSLAWRL